MTIPNRRRTRSHFVFVLVLVVDSCCPPRFRPVLSLSCSVQSFGRWSRSLGWGRERENKDLMMLKEYVAEYRLESKSQ